MHFLIAYIFLPKSVSKFGLILTGLLIYDKFCLKVVFVKQNQPNSIILSPKTDGGFNHLRVAWRENFKHDSASPTLNNINCTHPLDKSTQTKDRID
jgi:hypothetical protein